MQEVETLYEQCLFRVAWLLKTSYWRPDSEAFHHIPTVLIDSLIVRVTEISTIEPLRSYDLQLLLTSGRVRKFALVDLGDTINVTAKTLKKILMDLYLECDHLTEIKIAVNGIEKRKFHAITPALNALLKACRKLKVVQSNIVFDLRILSNCPQLRTLHVNFDLTSRIYDFIYVDGQWRTHNTLTRLILGEIEHSAPIYLETAPILKYCKKLVYFDIDIAKGLEQLHASEMNSGLLTHKYVIRDCRLGSVKECASEIAVRIASATCPDIKQLLLVVNDDKAISPLKILRKLKTLTIHYISKDSEGDYTTELQSLLKTKEFGHTLKNLEFHSFLNVDFHSISVSCPNLKLLSVIDCSTKDDDGNAILPIRFPKLEALMLEQCEDRILVKEEQLVDLLGNAANLEEISVFCKIPLTDRILEKVLKRNSLSKLKTLAANKCDLSLYGIRLLASSAKSLNYVRLGKSELKGDIRNVFRELNPCARVIFHKY